MIKGEPGSGKSILAVYLAKCFVSLEYKPLQKIGVVLPMTSLIVRLKRCLKMWTVLKTAWFMDQAKWLEVKNSI